MLFTCNIHFRLERTCKITSSSHHLTLSNALLHHSPQCHIYGSLKCFQGQRLHHVHGQPVWKQPVSKPDCPFLWRNPPWYSVCASPAQPEAVALGHITCHLRKETDALLLLQPPFRGVAGSDEVCPHPLLLQTKQSQSPQQLLIRLVLQALYQI